MAEPLTQSEQLAEKINVLQDKLLASDPTMPQYLNFIHHALLKQPELTYMLSNEQRSVILQALSKQTQVVITAGAAKKARAKSSSSITLDDIGL
jgi:hypothetical protein